MNKIKPKGDSNIKAGLDLALKVLSQRKYKNEVSSILLLSSSDDKSNEKSIGKVIESYKSIGVYSIHTFGLGNTHNSKLLTYIANQQNGNYYYIEHLKNTSICFFDCLSYLFASIA